MGTQINTAELSHRDRRSHKINIVTILLTFCRNLSNDIITILESFYSLNHKFNVPYLHYILFIIIKVSFY